MHHLPALALCTWLGAAGAAAWAQASCSSDGQPPPAALYERFTSADCEDCWASPSADIAPGNGTMVIDWITPGALGDDAPLSAAATRDALERLQAIGRPAPARTDTRVDAIPLLPAPALLRVAQGPVLADYLGASVRFIPYRAAADAHYQLTLLVIEAIPAGSEGSQVARNLVRNTFQRTWEKRHKLSKKEQYGWFEIRPMSVPDGARPERLRVAAWVHDARGHLVAAAQTRCDTGQ